MTDYLSRVCALFQAARKRAIVASAYLGASTLERILDSIPKTVTQVTVFTRWGKEDIASGATDWRAWDVARARSARLYACPRLHAKIYVADEMALVGSANATAAGLGGDNRGNLELLVPVKTEQVDVARVLDLVGREATEAVPIGFDATCDDVGHDVPVWLPEVGPGELLEALWGRKLHTAQTRRTCSVLRVPQRQDDDVLLRRSVRETTAFRIVGHEFESRPTPMTVDGLRALLADKVGLGFDDVSEERLAPLVHWLGHFGTNTHAVTSPEDTIPTLYPGKRLASYEFR